MRSIDERREANQRVRLLCASAVPSSQVVPDVLQVMHRIVPAEGYVFTWGGFKSEVQHLANPVRCEDDDEIQTAAA